MVKKFSEIELLEDEYHEQSKEAAISYLNKKIKDLYKKCLDIMDILNVDHNIKPTVRKQILDAGNGTIREIEEYINARYNIGFVPYKMNLKPKTKQEERDG